jgi:hypothetical protein
MASTTLCQRTFSKTIYNRETPTNTDVRCLDSGGNTINCNYFSVSIAPASSVTATVPSPAIFLHPFSGNINVVTPFTNANFGTQISSTAAGSLSPLGVSLLVTSGVSKYEYLCLPNEYFNTIRLIGYAPSPAGVLLAYNVCLTYGIVLPFNDLRAADKNLYTKGN